MSSNEVFVFGSNLAGRHGAGSALHARRYYGAVYGCGEGPQGLAYAIPTKGVTLNVLPLSEIKKAVARFVEYAKENPATTFRVVKIGCGLAGYTPQQIAPMFRGAPSNVVLDFTPEEMGSDGEESAGGVVAGAEVGEAEDARSIA